MTLHLVALPHLRVEPESCGCAYTAKNLKLPKMMRALADVILYAPEGPEHPYALETVELLSDAERTGIFGNDDPARLPAWPSAAQTALFNARAVVELSLRYEPGDLILLTAGMTHAPIMEALPEAIFCEPGVGYEGIATGLCAFESHAWRHYVYGKNGIADGRWFDTVIPNYFDPDEFHTASGSKDYLLFLGRVVPRKGPAVAAALSAQTGIPLVVAGAGARTRLDGSVEAQSGTPDEVLLQGDVTYVGPVGVEERAELLAGARALIAPTSYIEPFGGVAVEAMLSGVPAITTDFGAFTETVEQGVTGYRFRTLAEGVRAVELAADLDPQTIRQTALDRYSLDAVAPLFLEWFEMLGTLTGNGWYEMSVPSATMGE